MARVVMMVAPVSGATWTIQARPEMEDASWP